jgi:hypothetical protein
MAGHPFCEGEVYTIGVLRSVAAQIIANRKHAPRLSASMRTQRRKDIPSAKSWNEELYPFKLFADHKNLSDDDTFWWTPDGAADFTVRAGNALIALQSTMAYPEWSVATSQPGHVHHRAMEKLNTEGFYFGGGLISAPRARGPDEDLRAWRSGIESALRRKLSSGHAGCRLLIFARECGINTVDFSFAKVVTPAVEAVGSEEWERVFEAIYVLDEPEGAFVEFCQRIE